MTTNTIENSLTFPSLHLNGTSANVLTEEYFKAYYKIEEAINEMEKIQFHARDYYPQGEDAFQKARDEFNSRFSKMRDVQQEILEIAMYCQQFEK